MTDVDPGNARANGCRASAPSELRRHDAALARAPTRLAAVYAELAACGATGSLSDAVRFAGGLEVPYAAMIERKRSGRPPDQLL